MFAGISTEVGECVLILGETKAGFATPYAALDDIACGYAEDKPYRITVDEAAEFGDTSGNRYCYYRVCLDGSYIAGLYERIK
jgi:hypothetical protein